MKPWLVVSFVVATMLAGCTTNGPAEEQLNISISDVGGTPYIIGVPLWLAEGGPNATQWLSPSHAKINSGQVTQLHLNATDRGTLVWIAGNGTVTLGFEDVRSDQGSGFTRGAFSAGTGTDGLRPTMFVQQGDVDVQWFYEANSEDCFLTGSFMWLADGPGWHVAERGGRMSHSPPECRPMQ